MAQAAAVTDKLGLAYIGLATAWSLLLFSGMLFLWIHRHLPCIRIRRLPVMFAGVLSLHVYGTLCCLAYVIGPLVSCSAEFWIMSIYLPFGIAMFHAANSQFLHIASRQKQFAHMSSLRDHKPISQEQAERIAQSRWKRILHGTERADRVDLTVIFIGIGMAVQIALTLFVFFGSKKFHPSYGLFDYTVQGTGMEVRMNCSKGWEWWLSLVWQFFWAWVYAPYLLWKSREVRDVHGWRLQTVCCCIAGLPASPLWLSGLYIPQMAAVNKYVPPPSWFAISIFMMEVIIIVFPIFQIYRTNSLRKETLDAIENWEKRHQGDIKPDGKSVLSEDDSLKSPTTLTGASFVSYEKDSTRKASFESQKSDMLTMNAMENALRTNAHPLLEFAALKDFSGENVSFLTHVADWRRAWFSPKASTADHCRTQFIAAVRIYAHFVSLEYSEFPINISSREMKHLHNIFAATANRLFRCNSYASSTDSVTPFENVAPDSDSTAHLKTGLNAFSLGRANLMSVARVTHSVLFMEDLMIDVTVPDAFTETVFDAAESEIKYLVLTNTWPKFVNAACANSELGKEGAEEKKRHWDPRRMVLCSA